MELVCTEWTYSTLGDAELGSRSKKEHEYGLKKKSSAFPFLARNLKSRKIILVQGHTVKTVPVLE